MPSVTMKGGMAPLVMRKPLNAPVAAPAARQPRIPIHQGRPRSDVSIAPATPERARMDPTERSMPADEMTNVMPIASTPNTEVESRMLRMLETERKALDNIAMAPQSATRTISDSSRTAPPPAKRARHDVEGTEVEVEVIERSRTRRRRPPRAREAGDAGPAY